MLRFARRMVGVAAFTLFLSTAHSVFAVSPTPLQNAYWRFEEGPIGPVTPGDNDYVKDSINANHMRAFDNGTTPDYTSEVAPTPLKSGTADTMALNFSVHDDLYTDTTTTNKPINNGQIGGANGGSVTGYTLEAAFKPSALPGTFQGIVGREGHPNGSLNETLELKIRGDNNLLQIEQFDKAGTQVQVSSINQMNIGQWYYTAVVNDGSNLSLYLDSNDGNGYVLQGTTPVNGALFQGNDDWDKTWSIGRGFYNNNPADWFNGIIDEVRLSNKALAPWEFLFSRQGEYNGDNKINAGDYVGWRKSNIFGDDGYTLWRKHFEEDAAAATGLGPAAVPEPASILIAALAMIGVSGMLSARRCGNRRR
jgi:hypothetical protein